MTRSDPISLRLPEALKARLETAKAASGRSLNAEIKMRLEWSFEAGFEGAQVAPTPDNASELDALRARIRILESRLNALPADHLELFAELMRKLKAGEIVALKGSKV